MALLTTSPPSVSLADAERVAQACYPGSLSCAPLTGERDVNFRVKRGDGSLLTLKFINPAEALPETEMQIEVLKHLQGSLSVPAPHHEPADAAGVAMLPGATPATSSRGATLDWMEYVPLAGGPSVRVRAYGFLQGAPGTEIKADPRAWVAVGRVAGALNRALASFDHPAAHRQFLWDACQVLALRPLLGAVIEPNERELVAQFLTLFEQRVSPGLEALPRQIIHNDLSPSNVLVDQDGLTLVGILDFGDMVYAPRIAEIAIAASYLMAYSPEPLAVLRDVIAGYEQELPLTAHERVHVLDLVLARLVQRMVITSFRAERFPENRQYILRSHATAVALFNHIYSGWKRGLDARTRP